MSPAPGGLDARRSGHASRCCARSSRRCRMSRRRACPLVLPPNRLRLFNWHNLQVLVTRQFGRSGWRAPGWPASRALLSGKALRRDFRCLVNAPAAARLRAGRDLEGPALAWHWKMPGAIRSCCAAGPAFTPARRRLLRADRAARDAAAHRRRHGAALRRPASGHRRMGAGDGRVRRRARDRRRLARSRCGQRPSAVQPPREA